MLIKCNHLTFMINKGLLAIVKSQVKGFQFSSFLFNKTNLDVSFKAISLIGKYSCVNE